MTITRAIATAVVFAGAAVGLASPAWAEELNGNYEFVTLGSQRIAVVGDQQLPDPHEDARGQWALAPCGDGCTTVTSTSGWSAEMRLVEGRWLLSRPGAEGAKCDGIPAPSTFEYAFDATTLSGTFRQAGECQGKPAYTENPASLIKIG